MRFVRSTIQFALCVITVSGGSAAGQCPGVGDLAATSGDFFHSYGEHVVMSGDWAFVSSPRPSFFPAPDRGIVDIYQRSGSTWQFARQIRGDQLVGLESIGLAVAAAGDVAVFHAYEPNPSPSGPGTGAAVVLRRVGGDWAIEQIVKSPVPMTNEQFGAALAIEGDDLLIGAYSGVAPGGDTTGLVYHYRFDQATGWALQQTLLPSDGDDFDKFGTSVAISGDRAVIGAPEHDLPGGSVFQEEGAAYVFERVGGGPWAEHQKLVPTQGGTNQAFGTAVDIEGSHLVVGSPRDKGLSFDHGAAYVHQRNGAGNWVQQAIVVAPDGFSEAAFGASVSLAGLRLAVGAPQWDFGVGEVYLFSETQGQFWIIDQTIEACDDQIGDAFGASVALAGDSLLIGAPGDDASSSIPHEIGVLYSYFEQGSSFVPVSQHMMGPSMSASLGGEVNLHLDPDPNPGPGTYFMLGSISGTAPGVVLQGKAVPLNFDPYFAYLLTAPATINTFEFQGFISQDFPTTAHFRLNAGSPAILVGLRFDHAYLFVDGSTIKLVSEAEGFVVEP